MTKILLLRHGHVEGINPERFRGRADLPLTERGRREAQAVARRVAAGWSPTIVYTSPLQRCVATATMIAEACGVPSTVMPDLIDIDYGAWQFKSYEEVRASEPALFMAWFASPHLVRFPRGDSLQDLVTRSADALRSILHRHDGQTVVAVAHDSVNRAALIQLLDQPISSYWRIAQHPCCINEIDITAGVVRIERINETHHLDALHGV
jgi:probable phosphoglycerate mutase